jgi:hypothetical protein
MASLFARSDTSLKLKASAGLHDNMHKTAQAATAAARALRQSRAAGAARNATLSNKVWCNEISIGPNCRPDATNLFSRTPQTDADAPFTTPVFALTRPKHPECEFENALCRAQSARAPSEKYDIFQ